MQIYFKVKHKTISQIWRRLKEHEIPFILFDTSILRYFSVFHSCFCCLTLNWTNSALFWWCFLNWGSGERNVNKLNKKHRRT